jgi:hypothetical protein
MPYISIARRSKLILRQLAARMRSRDRTTMEKIFELAPQVDRHRMVILFSRWARRLHRIPQPVLHHRAGKLRTLTIRHTDDLYSVTIIRNRATWIGNLQLVESILNIISRMRDSLELVSRRYKHPIGFVYYLWALSHLYYLSNLLKKRV